MTTSTGTHVLAALNAFALKPKGGGRYRSNSPLRAGDDSYDFSLHIASDGEHGCWQDFKTGDKGSLYDLAEKLGIPLPDHTQEVSLSSKRTYTGLADYAAAHGVDESVFVEAGWREGMLGNRKCLFFPTGTGERWRFLDGEKPRFGNKSGYKSSWYGLQRALRLLQENDPIVLCNGEASVVVAQYFKVAATALTTSGEKTDIPPHLMAELKAAVGDKTPILIALDCDDKGRVAAQGLHNTLKNAGFNARAVDLNLGFVGADVADFCKLWGEDSFTHLLQLPDLGSQPALPTLNDIPLWKDYDITDLPSLPPVSWLIPGEIVENGINIIYGMPASGKSFKALDYAMRIIQGGGKVIYLAYEGESGYGARALAWCEHQHVPFASLKGKARFILGHLELMEMSEFNQFASIAHQMQPKLIIIDTLGRAMTGMDAKEGKDVNIFMKMCAKLKILFNCAVLLVHHTNKGGREEFGSVYLRANADSVIFVAEDDGLITIEAIKTKDGSKFQTYRHKLMPVKTVFGGKEFASAVLMPAEKIIQTASDPITSNQRKVLEMLALGIYDEGARFTDIQTETGLATSTSRCLSQLKKLAFVELNNNLYTLTEAGRKTLSPHDAPPQKDALDAEDAGDAGDKVNGESIHADVPASSASSASSASLHQETEVGNTVMTSLLDQAPEKDRYYTNGG